MRHIIKIAIFLLILAAMVFVFVGGWDKIKNRFQDKTYDGPVLSIGSAQVQIEIADEEEEQRQGLSGRGVLEENRGMLFIYQEPRRLTFWMKETLIPLDILFISQGKVVDVFSNVSAPKEGQDGREIRVAASIPVDMALEVNSGWAQKSGVKVGDEVVLVSE